MDVGFRDFFSRVLGLEHGGKLEVGILFNKWK